MASRPLCPNGQRCDRLVGEISALEPISEPVPEAALELLAASSPSAGWQPRLHRSGRSRRPPAVDGFSRSGEWRGGLTARELKQTARPTGLWLDHPASPGRLRGAYSARRPEPANSWAGRLGG